MTNENVNRSLQRWHEMIRARDLSGVKEIVHPEARFRSPVAFKPYESADAVHLVLNTVIEVFKDFEYHRFFVSDDGLSVVLEFSATVGTKGLKGIDMIRFDEDGLITDFEVMIRPWNALEALKAEMGDRLGHLIGQHRN